MLTDSNLDLGKLRQFLELARIGNYGRAAARLKIGQPQLSLTMQKFEQELGADLLERHSRGVVVTEFGKNVAQIGEEILSSVARINSLRKGLDSPHSEKVVVGLPPSLGAALTGPLFKEFQRSLPDKQVHFIEAVSSVLEREIVSRRVDIAFLYDPSNIRSLTTYPLLRVDLVFVFGPVWNLSLPSRPLRLREVTAFPLILPTVTHAERRLLLKAEAQLGLHLQPILEVDSPLTLRALVNAGLGATIASGVTFSNEIATGNLTSHSISGPSLKATLHLGTSSFALNTESTANFVGIVRKCITALMCDQRWPGTIILD